MPEVDEDALGASSTPPDADVTDSSSAEPQTPASSETAPPQPAAAEPSVQAAEPVSFDQHPRWQERQRELEALRAQNQQLLDAVQRIAQPVTQAQPPADPYAGMDAATAEFYRNMDRRIEQKAQEISVRQMQPILQSMDLGRQQLAKVTLVNFYKENPDITPNSAEAQAIAQKIQQGYDLEDAKWVVMGPKYHQQLTQQRQTTGKKQEVHRQQAPPEGGPGIPATSGLPQPKETFRDTLARELDLA